ncbi:sulfite oxidase heme-binding subunit YedZ [Chloroflexota bacterium]
MKTIKKPTLLQVIIFIGAWLPLIRIIYLYFNGGLGVNPIQDLEQRTGRIAITLLVISLAATPLNILTGWREISKRNRALGLYAFMYANIHVITFLWLDYGFDLGQILGILVEKYYIIFGTLTFLILLSLALTSFDSSKRWLKKNWKKLHKLVYYAGILVVIHYALAKKGDIFSLQGDVVRPFVYGIIVILLLLMRYKPIRSFIQTQRKKIVSTIKSRKQSKDTELV